MPSNEHRPSRDRSNDVGRMPPHITEGFNAAQIAEMQRAVAQIVENIKLRQWCIEQAAKVAANLPSNIASFDTVAMARAMYEFIAEVGATES